MLLLQAGCGAAIRKRSLDLDRRCPSVSIDGGLGGTKVENSDSKRGRKKKEGNIKTTSSKALLGRAG